MSEPSQQAFDVAVVGAGLSGLIAARALVAAGLSTVVLEARDRVGGRTFSRNVGEAVFDLGGQYLGLKQHRMLQLVSELGLHRTATPHTGTKWIELGARRASYDSAIPKMPPLALIQVQLFLSRVDRISRGIQSAAPWTASNAAALDRQTVESWWRRFIFGRDAHLLLQHTIRMTFGCEADEMSLLSLLQYTSGAHGLSHMTATEGGSQEEYLTEGTQEISKRIAAKLGDRVVLSAPVRRIAQDESGVTVRADSGVWRAQRVIIAMPPLLTGRIDYSPTLPLNRTALVQRFPMGAVIKCIALYDRPFWRERGYSGEVISDRGAVGVAFDCTKANGKQPALVGFIEGARARAWSDRSPEERRRTVLRELAGFLGPEAEQPTEYFDQDWTAEQWTGGCSAGHATTGALSHYGPALREPIGRIHWAGTETAREWFGYMEGAVEAGERAADEVIARRDKATAPVF